MATKKTPQRPLSDHTQLVVQTIMGKPAQPAKANQKQVGTVLGAQRGK